MPKFRFVFYYVPILFQAVIHTAILGDFAHIHLPALLGKVTKGLTD